LLRGIWWNKKRRGTWFERNQESAKIKARDNCVLTSSAENFKGHKGGKRSKRQKRQPDEGEDAKKKKAQICATFGVFTNL